MNKLKVITVVGTRPEVIRLSRVIAKLDIFCEHVLVHTGQNYDYELNQVFFDDLGVRRPDFFLNSADDTSSASSTIGNIIVKIDGILDDVKPDAMLVLGDTNSCLSLISAKRRKIPTFHMEAGNRCFDQRVPEEINRRIVDHTADMNLTYSDIARDYLLREGLPPDLIIKTGSPMFEVLSFYKKNIGTAKILSSLGLEVGDYYLVSAHREENIETENSLSSLIKSLNIVAETKNKEIIISAHPRMQKKVEKYGAYFHPRIRLIKPLGFFDYVHLQMNAKAVLSDSGTITEESSILKFPALNLREAHERPEGMEEAAVMMVGLEANDILRGLSILENSKFDSFEPVKDYHVSNVSEKVVRIIHSYHNYINRVIWKKY